MKMRSLTAGISLMLLFFIFIPAVHADSGKTYEVGANNLNVRTAPSHSAQIIGKLNSGDRVVAFEEAFGWVKTYYDGQVAWVASQFLYQADNQGGSDSGSSSASVSNASPEQVTVTATEVRIRTGPGTEHKIIGYTSKGDTYSLVKSANNWNKVALSDGSTGWIAGWLTDYNNGGKNTPDTANTSNDNSSNHDAVPQSNNTANGSLAGYNIVLDPGHGGKDPGAIGIGGIYEKDVIMNTVDNIAQKLRAAGATVILTRDSDYFLTLEKRVQMSSSYNTHAFISLHYNAYPVMGVNGVSTHYYSGGADRQLASSLQSAIGQHVNLYSRGIIRSDYHVLRENSDLAVLIELGFITNPGDLAAAQTNAYQNNVADGIVDGLLNYFN
ncbi:N-acetylmuramoyl-L-alanine amidase [Virgibacillus siamensis]|uniref:N-acetylmuramoyl-L-alanine amidase n=1 Tax=Virgibacillus siamensis TaxID=480071 RepID=UPI000984AF6A|nr:N-acetylmuramoyl-L-alanine amidase [Virgibacillus siamensis]